jgi:hypothetical protein
MPRAAERLRHTGNHLAAQTGASLRNLMIRMGHDSMRAALIYQHASETGDRRIADALDAVIEAASEGPTDVETQAPAADLAAEKDADAADDSDRDADR